MDFTAFQPPDLFVKCSSTLWPSFKPSTSAAPWLLQHVLGLQQPQPHYCTSASLTLPSNTLSWIQHWLRYPLPPPLTLLDLQLHKAMSNLQSVGLAMLPPGLHSIAAVIPTVLQGQVPHHDVKGSVAVRNKLHPVMAGLAREGRVLGAIAQQLMVPAQVVVQLLLSDVADVSLLGAALVSIAAEVPGLVEQVVAVGKGTADPAGQGNVLALGADAE